MLMQIHILGYDEAEKHIPKVPTYAIRIWNTHGFMRPMGRGPLINSPNYKKIQSYEFDDISHPETGKICFDNNIAKKILIDFQQDFTGCEALLVHCTVGENRSPAVALALNQIFNLGNDSDELYDKFPELSRIVYTKCLQASKEIGLGDFEIYGHPTLGTYGQMMAREKRLQIKAKKSEN